MNPTTVQKVPFVLVALSQGQPVDLAVFPTALTAIAYSVDNADVADVVANPDVPNGVFLVPKAAGTVVLTVQGTNTANAVVSGTATVNFDQAVPVVDSVGLTAGDPVAV